MEKLDFYWFGYESPLFQQAKDLRHTVFVQEQGFSATGEFDETDRVARHLLMCYGGRAVGVARLYGQAPGVLHAGRVALLADCRGKGLGLSLMEELRREAEKMGAEKLILSAQADKAAFYEKAGYTLTGRQILDEGCPHVEMRRAVRNGE